MINEAGIRITGKKSYYDIEKIAGFIIIFILLFSIFFQINQIISINSGYFEEEITENIEEKLMNTVNTEEKKLSEIKAEEIAEDEKINKIINNKRFWKLLQNLLLFHLIKNINRINILKC